MTKSKKDPHNSAPPHLRPFIVERDCDGGAVGIGVQVLGGPLVFVPCTWGKGGEHALVSPNGVVFFPSERALRDHYNLVGGDCVLIDWCKPIEKCIGDDDEYEEGECQSEWRSIVEAVRPTSASDLSDLLLAREALSDIYGSGTPTTLREVLRRWISDKARSKP